MIALLLILLPVVTHVEDLRCTDCTPQHPCAVIATIPLRASQEREVVCVQGEWNGGDSREYWSDSVKISRFPTSKVLGYRAPND